MECCLADSGGASGGRKANAQIQTQILLRFESGLASSALGQWRQFSPSELSRINGLCEVAGLAESHSQRMDLVASLLWFTP